jgi:hypothetical protein
LLVTPVLTIISPEDPFSPASDVFKWITPLFLLLLKPDNARIEPPLPSFDVPPLNDLKKLTEYQNYNYSKLLRINITLKRYLLLYLSD